MGKSVDGYNAVADGENRSYLGLLRLNAEVVRRCAQDRHDLVLAGIFSGDSGLVALSASSSCQSLIDTVGNLLAPSVDAPVILIISDVQDEAASDGSVLNDFKLYIFRAFSVILSCQESAEARPLLFIRLCHTPKDSLYFLVCAHILHAPLAEFLQFSLPAWSADSRN